jgi:hypothetical protein
MMASATIGRNLEQTNMSNFTDSFKAASRVIGRPEMGSGISGEPQGKLPTQIPVVGLDLVVVSVA